MQSDVMGIPPPPASAVTLESKVAFLRQATSFPEPTYRVEAIETHMSWVFLTDAFAYKLKKPVRNDFIDFSTIQARSFYCQEEVRLNRRLASGIYLGTVPLAFNTSGHLQLTDGPTIVDWLVKMRRLPMHHMLDYAIIHGSANENDIGRLAARLARFYRSCAPIAIGPAEYRNRLLFRIDAQFLELSSPDFQLSSEQLKSIFQAQRNFLNSMSALLDARVLAGRIVEGHGDLRPEHICLEAEPTIIDCLEFSRDLRTLDRADELAFLALECERLGAGGLGALLLRSYSQISNDWPSATLIHFYQSYRASLRATIALRHLKEQQFRYSPEWPRRAKAYLQLAERHAACCR